MISSKPGKAIAGRRFIHGLISPNDVITGSGNNRNQTATSGQHDTFRKEEVLLFVNPSDLSILTL
ncbi:MAG: hypothetical protein IT242_06170 [Bacteroidia bacterium]|nr:hypothetical protein [Bacteroidia bacterium]